MPSKTDFNQQAKMAYQTVQTSKEEGGFSVFAKNFYRRSVTINNTGKTAKTNYYVAVIFDTFQTYVNFKINLGFNCLRVYDSDGLTRLEHYVQTAGSDQTVVFVRIPSLPASSKTIFFEYGNTGLPSLNNEINKPARSSNFWNFNKNTFKDWFVGHNSRRRMFTKFNSAYNDFVFNNVQNWSNLKNTANWGLFLDSDYSTRSVPLLNGHTGSGSDVKINGLDTVFFNGNSRLELQSSVGSFKPVNNANNSYFAIALRTGTLSSSIRAIIGSQTNGIAITLSATQQLRITQTGVTNYIVSSTTLANNTNYILECWLRPTTGSGFSATVRINNVIQTATGTHASFPNSLLHFSSLGGNPTTSFAQVYISEILYFNGANTTSTDDTNLRNDVYNYLNTKYRIVGSADMPAITVGAETTITNNITDNYVSYNSLSEFSSQSELEHGFFGCESNKTEVNIKKILEKPFLSARLNFTNSTLNLQNKITEKASRQYTATTSSGFAISSNFALNVGAENYANLTKFWHKDVVENTFYLSDNFDYISFELNTPTDNINLSTCELLFSDTAPSPTKNLTINFGNQKITEGLNTLVFAKKDFLNTGNLNWQDVRFAYLRIRLNSGSQTVYFGNFKLIKNYEELAKAGDKILLGQAVSLDQNTTFFKDQINLNFANQIFNNEKNVSIQTENILNKFFESSFDELPGWLDDGRQFFPGKESEPFEPNTIFNNKILKRIMTLAFPYQLLDFQSLPEARMNQDETIFVARGEFKVRDYLEPLLNIYGSSIYFDETSQKIKLTTGFQKFEVGSPSLESEVYIQESEILDFPENTSKDQQIYNSIAVPSYYIEPTITDNVYYGNYLPLTSLPSPVQIPAGTTQEVFINLEDFDNLRGDFAVYLDNLRLSDAQLSTTENGTLQPGFAVSVEYRNLKFLPPYTVVFTVQNNSANTRWLRQVSFNGAFIVYYTAFPNSATNTSLTYEYENKESIKKFGKSEFPVGNLRIPASTSSDQPLTLRNFWQNTIDNFSGLNKFAEIELTINNNPLINLNTRVKLKNKQGVLVSGVVSNVSVNQANKKTITIYLTS